MKMQLDLGKDYSVSEPVGSPVKGEKHYPCLHIDGDDELSGIPDEGVITLRYRLSSRATNTRDGETNHSITLEALEVLDVEGESSREDEDSDRSSNLDKLASEKVAAKKKAAKEESEE